MYRATITERCRLKFYGNAPARKNFLFPVTALSFVFRGKFLDLLKSAFATNKLLFVGHSACLAGSRFRSQPDPCAHGEANSNRLAGRAGIPSGWGVALSLSRIFDNHSTPSRTRPTGAARAVTSFRANLSQSFVRGANNAFKRVGAISAQGSGRSLGPE